MTAMWNFRICLIVYIHCKSLIYVNTHFMSVDIVLFAKDFSKERELSMSIRILLAGFAVFGASMAFAAEEPIKPIRPPANINLGMVELGKKLYFDPRLSKSGFISCNSCHNLSMGGTDNIKTSIGHNWQEGPINAPTVLNSSLTVAQFWDGRAADLKAQAGGPI
ncbi:partial Cytochrome c551 peroxidase, partial [Rhodocyclaceae bacterium]